MTTAVQNEAVARGVLAELRDDLLVLRLSDSDYRLHLVPAVPASSIATAAGRKVRGVVEARALRIHPARAGGRFIEPVWGEPRIVQGVVLAAEGDRVLVDAVVPMWVTVHEGQSPGELAPGQLVNFYVQSGTTFRPV